MRTALAPILCALALAAATAPFTPVAAQETALDAAPADDDTQRMPLAEGARIMALTLPENAPKKVQVDYWLLRQRAAFTVGNSGARLEALRKLVELTTEQGKHSPYVGYLFNEEWRSGNQTKALELGENRLEDPLIGESERATTAAQIGHYYLVQGNRDKARALLGRAERIRRSQEATPGAPDLLYVAIEVENLRASILYAEGDAPGAEAAARKALQSATREIARVRALPPGAGRTMVADRALRVRDATMHMLVAAQIAQGKNIEAEGTARLGLRNAAAEKTEGATVGYWYGKLAQARLAQRRYLDAQAFANQSIAALREAQLGASAARMMDVSVTLLQTLFGLESWAEADRLSQALVAATADDAVGRTRIDSPVLRALLHLNNGRFEQAFQTIDGAVKYRARNYGEDNPATVEAKAVRAMVYQKREETRNALQDYGDVFRSIFAQETTFSDAEPAGLRGYYLPLALRSYMRLVQTNYVENGGRLRDDDMLFNSFRVADRLRASVVQRALTDSAARVVADTPELAALIRREQDQRSEMRERIAQLGPQLEEDARLTREWRERDKARIKADERWDAALTKKTEDEAKARREAIEANRKRIAELEKLRGQAVAEIARRFPRYAALVNPKPPTLAETARALDKGGVLVSIFPTQAGVFVWGVDAQGRSAFHFAALPASDLTALVNRLRNTLDIGSRPDWQGVRFDADAGAEIYARLVGPILAALPGAKSVTFAVGGDLAQIPFGVLVTRKVDADTAAAAMPWLVNDFAVSQVSTVAAFVALQGTRRGAVAPKPFAGFADPLFNAAAAPGALHPVRAVLDQQAAAKPGAVFDAAFDYSTVPPLPETRAEVLALAALLGADPAKDVWLGREASRARVLATDLSDRRVIAFATHGLRPGGLPGLSRPALAMAGTGDPDASPLLTLDDVLTLKLNSEWVVLSACNSASADGRAEEALSGLARGFFFAGTRAVLVTHWPVETDSARELVTRTFQYYTKTADLGRAESLRRAQLDLIAGRAGAQYAQPFFWAPYAVSGDPGR